MRLRTFDAQTRLTKSVRRSRASISSCWRLMRCYPASLQQTVQYLVLVRSVRGQGDRNIGGYLPAQRVQRHGMAQVSLQELHQLRAIDYGFAIGF